MKKQVAVRNLRLCTKDCLCLYVCPTGAADTENSIIDVNKCIGCESCVKACPSGAISIVPLHYPPQQKKPENVLSLALTMSRNKTKQEAIAKTLATSAANKELATLMKAIEKSVRLVHEDLVRESGYMLPQSNNTHILLNRLLEQSSQPTFPAETVRKLLSMLDNNEEEKKNC